MATEGGTTKYESAGAINANTTPPVVTTLPTYHVGDLMLVAAWYAQSVGTTGHYTPAGFTRLTEFSSDSTVRAAAVYACVVTSEGQFSGGITLRDGSTSTRVSAVFWVLTPEEGEAFFIEDLVASTYEWNGAAASSDTFPAGISGDFVYGVMSSGKSASATYTTHSGAGGATAINQARSLAAPGTGSVSDSVVSVWRGGTGTTFNVSQANSVAYTIGVVVGVEVPPPPAGWPVKLGDGSDAYMSVLDASSDRQVPARIRQFFPGFNDIGAMVAKDGATWAHRGGSAAWPEMSEYAYDQSVMRGYGVLEFSGHWTSDDVMFGLHDDTLARTSENGALTTAVSSMTWSAVQAHMNTLNDDGIPRPYYTLDDFLEKYTDHILLIENKGGFNNTAFLAKLAAVPNALSRIIIKWDGSLVVARFQESKAAGFYVAGYWYDDYASKLPTREPYTDFIGMPYTSTQTIWDDVATYGKQLWAHLALSQGNYNTARTKGANFVQCGGVDVIAPVGPVIG